MNLKELTEHPAIVAHFPDVANSIDEFLVEHLVQTCVGSPCTSDSAQAEIAAAKAIANLINVFRGLNNKKEPVKKITIKQLNRFQPKPSQTDNQT